MRKADVIAGITAKTGKEKESTESILDAFFKVVQSSLINGENFLSGGFGTFLVKKRAAKIGRNITQNTAVQIPKTYIPAFRPADEFKNKAKAAEKWRVNRIVSIV